MDAPRWSRLSVLVVAVCCLSLVAGWALKHHCADLEWNHRDEYKELCYSDIGALYSSRGVDRHVFPYVHGSIEGGLPAGGMIEYPVLTGLFMWAVGLLAHGRGAYVTLNALFLAPAAIWSAYLLTKMKGARAFIFAAAPPLIFYAFHNWDILAVAAVVSAMYAWWTGRPYLSAVLLGIGAALKLYPIFLLPALALDLYSRNERGKALKVVAWGAAAFIVPNLPFIVINAQGWWATYAFHGMRTVHVDSLWALLPFDLSARALDLISGSLLVATLALIWARGLKVARSGEFPFLQVCAATVAALFLWGKVQSPQYSLWLLPFLVLVEVDRVLWLGSLIIDAILFVAIFSYFGSATPDDSVWLYVMLMGVALRAGFLGMLIKAFLWDEATPKASNSSGKRRLAVSALALALVVVAGACSGDDPAPTSPPTPSINSPSPTPSVSLSPTLLVPTCSNMVEALADPALRLPGELLGDVDGDGADDSVSLVRDDEGPVGCRTFVVAETASRVIAVPAEDPQVPFALQTPHLNSLAQVDGAGGLEILVDLEAGASTQFVGMFQVAGAEMRRIEIDDDPTGVGLFPYGGSVGHLEASDCAGSGSADVVISVATPKGDGYEVIRTFYTLVGGVLSAAPEPERVTVGSDRVVGSRFPEFAASPFGSCPR